MRLVTDNASSTLVAPILPTDTVLQLTPSGGLNFPSPGPGEYAIITIEDELARREKVKLTGRVDDTLTVERDVEDPALSFSIGARVELRSTASLLSLFYQKNEGDTVDAGTEITLLLQRYLATGDGPVAGDLVEGEVAINIPDGKVWAGAVGATEGNPLAPVVLNTGADGGVEVTQGAHNFSPGQPIFLNGTTWQRADAGFPGDAVGTHVVGEVRSASSFTAISNGPVSGVTPADLGLVSIVVGQLYYVDPITPGQYVDVEPVAPGQFSNPLALGLSASSLYVLPWRATEAGGGGGSGGSVDTIIAQTGHGFTEADNTGAPVYFDGALWNLAQANAVATLGVAVIKSVSDINTFTITQAGQLENISEAVNGAAPLTPGEYYFVDPTTPGQITSTEPTSAAVYSNPLLLALTANSALVLPFRPMGDINNRTVTFWTGVAGQTIFAAENDGALDVYINGVRQVKDVDYTQTAAGFTLLVGVADNADEVVSVAYPSVALANVYTQTEVDALLTAQQVQIAALEEEVLARPVQNLILNGSFQIAQRTANPVTSTFTADRMRVSGGGSYTWAVGPPSASPILESGLLTLTPAAQALMQLATPLELPFVGEPGVYAVGEIFTISIYANVPSGQEIRLTTIFRDSSGSATNQVIDVNDILLGTGTGSWERLSHTFTIGASPAGTSITYVLVLNMADAAATAHSFAGFMLTKGDLLLPFPLKIPNEEEIDCQRYYQRVVALHSGNTTSGQSYFAAGQLQTRLCPQVTPVLGAVNIANGGLFSASPGVLVYDANNAGMVRDQRTAIGGTGASSFYITQIRCEAEL